MAAINVTSVNVLDNPSLFSNPLQFEVSYECLYDLNDGAAGRPGPALAPAAPSPSRCPAPPRGDPFARAGPGTPILSSSPSHCSG